MLPWHHPQQFNARDIMNPHQWYVLPGRRVCHYMIGSPVTVGVCGQTSEYRYDQLLCCGDLQTCDMPRKCEQCMLLIVPRAHDLLEQVIGNGLRGLTLGQYRSPRKDHWVFRAWRRFNPDWDKMWYEDVST